MDLGVLPGYEWSQAVALSDAGVVVGTSHAGNHTVSCFMYADGAMRNMGALGGTSSPFCNVHAINAAGQSAHECWNKDERHASSTRRSVPVGYLVGVVSPP